MKRDEAIKEIKEALKARSGFAWSVSGGRGTGWGSITIRARKPRAANEYGYLTEEDAALLGELLGLGRVSRQGVLILPNNNYYEEYVSRARGEKPRAYGYMDWD
jgi:hypothetical protein